MTLVINIRKKCPVILDPVLGRIHTLFSGQRFCFVSEFRVEQNTILLTLASRQSTTVVFCSMMRHENNDP